MVFVPLVSAAACKAMNNLGPDVEKPDNVLLEWLTALHLAPNRGSGLQAIMPVFVSKSAESDFWSDGTYEELDGLPHVVHEPTKIEHDRHLDAMGFPVNDKRMTVHAVASGIMKYQSKCNLRNGDGEGNYKIDGIVESIQSLVVSVLSKSSNQSPSESRKQRKPMTSFMNAGDPFTVTICSVCSKLREKFRSGEHMREEWQQIDAAIFNDKKLAASRSVVAIKVGLTILIHHTRYSYTIHDTQSRLDSRSTVCASWSKGIARRGGLHCG
jgi:hypothetical protein